MLQLFVGLQTWIATHRDREEGQALVEYALILMLVAMVSVTILGAIGQNVLGPLTSVGNAL